MYHTIPRTLFVIDMANSVAITATEPKHKAFVYYRFDDQYLAAADACEKMASHHGKNIADFLDNNIQPNIYPPKRTPADMTKTIRPGQILA